MPNEHIDLPADAIDSIHFYLSPRFLELEAPDPVTASFMISVGVKAAIETFSEQVVPGISKTFHFHKEEREGQVICTGIHYRDGAAPVGHLEHLGNLLRQITQHAVPQAIEMMQMARAMDPRNMGNRAARRRAARRQAARR